MKDNSLQHATFDANGILQSGGIPSKISHETRFRFLPFLAFLYLQFPIRR